MQAKLNEAALKRKAFPGSHRHGFYNTRGWVQHRKSFLIRLTAKRRHHTPTLSHMKSKVIANLLFLRRQYLKKNMLAFTNFIWEGEITLKHLRLHGYLLWHFHIVTNVWVVSMDISLSICMAFKYRCWIRFSLQNNQKVWATTYFGKWNH